MAAQVGKGASVGLMKRMWHELPDIVAGTALSLFSIAGIIALYNYKKSAGLVDIKRYRFEYTVVRSDDPLAAHAPKDGTPKH